MPVLRWLLPIIAVIAIAGSSVAGVAAAGMTGDAACCCPVKAKCKCHDHDGNPGAPPTPKRCSGDGKLVAPMLAAALAPPPLEVGDAPRTPCPPAWRPPPLPEERAVEIEIPPS